MEKKFVFKNLPISPKKLRFLLPPLRKISPVGALDYLFYMPKKGAKILRKAIKSAIDAVKSSLKIEENKLKFKTLAVDEGRKLKRFRPGGRGTVKPIVRRFSHLTIVLTDEEKNEKKQLKIKKKS
jgi:large subunit ribosomal protein L22